MPGREHDTRHQRINPCRHQRQHRTFGGGEARGVEPQGLEVSKYEISGAGPAALGPVTLTKGQSAEHTFSPVAPGQWTITAKAFATSNSIDYVVGESSQTIAVTPGQTANAAITITEKTGEGTITFNILDSDHVLQSLTATVATDLEMSSPPAEIKLKYDNDSKMWAGSTSLEKGFYAVKIANEDNTVFTMDSVRIYAGITTVYSAKYNGEILDVTITDQIVPTPDLSLTVTPSESVASNGKIEAVASVSNLDNLTYAWYVNGAKVQGDANKLVYSLDGKGFSGDQVLQVTVFVTQDSVIWSESRELAVTEAVTLPDDSEISITTNELKYGEESGLTYSGEFAEGVELKWSVNNEAIEGDIYTPNTIGKNVSIILTATLDGVSKDYASTVAINPVVNVLTTSSQVPVNAIIDVVADVKAPEGYVLTITANDQEVTYQNDKVTLENISAGDVSLGWKLTFNGDEWTGTSGYSVVINESEASDAPTGNADVGGQSDEEKRTFINNLLNDLRSLAEHEPKYETTGGDVNLTSTLKVTGSGYELYGFKASGDTNTFWGTIDADDADLTVRDDSGNVFTISKEGSTYKLNGIILEIAPPVPEVNTDGSFMGSATEKYQYVMAIFAEVMNSGNLDSLAPNPDGEGWLMEGYKTANYMVWGVAVVDDSGNPTSLEVIVQNNDSEVFEVRMENGIFYLNDVECKKQEEVPLEPPVEPTESIGDNPTTPAEDTMYDDIYTAQNIAFGSSIPLEALLMNCDMGSLSSHSGNFKFTLGYQDGMTVASGFEVVKDIPVTFTSGTQDNPEFHSEEIILKAGSFSSSMSDESDVVFSRYETDENGEQILRTYAWDADAMNYIIYSVDEDGNRTEIVVSGDESQDEFFRLREIGVFAYQVLMCYGNDEMYNASSVKSQWQSSGSAKIPLHLTSTGEGYVYLYSIDMKSAVTTGVPLVDLLVSLQDYHIVTEEGTPLKSISTPGFRCTSVYDENANEVKMMRGPITIDGKEYYYDLSATIGPEGSVYKGGFRYDNQWYSVPDGM